MKTVDSQFVDQIGIVVEDKNSPGTFTSGHQGFHRLAVRGTGQPNPLASSIEGHANLFGNSVTGRFTRSKLQHISSYL